MFKGGRGLEGFSPFSGKKVDVEKPKSQEEVAREYLRKADLHVIECVDERVSDGAENGVEIPGAVYGMVDAVKSILGLTEEQAWDYMCIATRCQLVHTLMITMGKKVVGTQNLFKQNLELCTPLKPYRLLTA